ncbi:aminoacyl-tRNA hydrolase [Rubripirellula amarantea]|uniref:Peptidyl-tRNA hydrolase n=1 Tax=Rubripirellula amarantea TaxID=2527999 RepID=A0A5C5WFA9_9BACT|nr:aminoacyl-tRNA hydrolase [Rubripirellula amarantea]MDA8743173.1 aminoacyl-tRNA hydrolase [Rubripirellula amarantea]TWT49438.1 Peptidyl-tRNA hydrolase [Rubripirellula amarantea]
MKLIVGLGNPGRKYDQTRHNVGFVTLAKVASLTCASPSKVRFEGDFAEAMWANQKIALLWPQTFMNLSGQSVRKAVDFFKLVPTDDLLVICDDLDLDVGRIRIKRNGSAGGQRGVADIIRHLASEDFARLKVGIGRPPKGWDTADYVLGKFGSAEADAIETVTTTAARAAMDWVTDGCSDVMAKYNHVGKPPKKDKSKPRPQSDSSEPSGQAGL